MSYEEARRIIKEWLTSTEHIAAEWRIILPMCLELIDEKIKTNNNGK